MTEHHTDNDPAELKPTEAKAAKSNVGLRYVLGISILAIIVVMAIVVAKFMSANGLG